MSGKDKESADESLLASSSLYFLSFSAGLIALSSSACVTATPLSHTKSKGGHTLSATEFGRRDLRPGFPGAASHPTGAKKLKGRGGERRPGCESGRGCHSRKNPSPPQRPIRATETWGREPRRSGFTPDAPSTVSRGQRVVAGAAHTHTQRILETCWSGISSATGLVTRHLHPAVVFTHDRIQPRRMSEMGECRK